MRFFLLFMIMLSGLHSKSHETITLQLKWTHAFQFAGYYAAKEKGYYKEAGLDVTIVEATPKTDPLEEVLTKKAQYGVGTSSLLLSYISGKPVVVLGVIFQQSPYEIHTVSSITSLHDLVGKTLMMEPQSEELLAYLQKEGISTSQIHIIPHSFNQKDLIDGKTDAMSGYISNEPFYYNKAKYVYRTFTPRSAGIDFYGDNLFTTQEELKNHPERVKAFRDASMRGWAYAKEHREEIIDLIISKYAPHLSKEYLLYESDQMIPLLQPDLIEIGYMNPKRWKHIANTFASLGLIPKTYDLEHFIYVPNHSNLPAWALKFFLASLLILTVITIILFYFIKLSKQLREQKKLNEQLLIQQQKMGQMGEMMSMIAHQWRQPLSAITTIIGALQMKISLGYYAKKENPLEALQKELTDAFDKIEHSATFLSNTINDFRNFYSPNKPKTTFEVSRMIERIAQMALADKGLHNIQVQLDLATEIKIHTFENELMQVILNLLNNAKDAIIEHGIENPLITIILKGDENTVFISVTDNAGGIPEGVIDKIFDPYFSTKKQKNGTGLGLYMSKIIVQTYLGGSITVTNNPHGAHFEITLPRTTERDIS